jgi:hypothetical protein
MPWKVVKRGDKWCVVRSDTGEAVPGGCHETKAEAEDHRIAIQINYSKGKESK